MDGFEKIVENGFLLTIIKGTVTIEGAFHDCRKLNLTPPHDMRWFSSGILRYKPDVLSPVQYIL